MELFKGMKKAASDVKPSDLQKELKAVLTRSEKVEKAYLLPQGMLVFTDKRLMIREAAAAADEAAPCHSIPYRSVTHFSMAPLQEPEAGVQLSIWIHGDPAPIQKALEQSPLIPELHRTLADYVLNKHSPWMNKQLAWKKHPGSGAVKALGLTGAAMVTVLCFKKMHGKHHPLVPTPACPGAALAAMLRKRLKG